MAIEQFKYEINPLEKDRVYQAANTDVTDFVMSTSPLIRQVDDGDFDIGVFTYDEVKMDMYCGGDDITTSGRFYDVNSASSIFKHRRDLAKVILTYIDSTSAETTLFTGLINDVLTRDDYDNGVSYLTVLGLAGIFSKYSVVGGSVGDGMTIKEALESLLDRPFITDYLNYSSNNMNPALNVTIDRGSELDNLSYKAALDKLMLAAGSVLIVDSANNIIVKDRGDNANTPNRFYNSGDPEGRVNIIRLDSYNTGVQRAFNLYEIDKTVAKDDSLINEFGLRRKAVDVSDIITNTTTRQAIVDYYLENFSIPKQEVVITTEIKNAKSIELLDLCALDFRPVVRNDDMGNPFSFPDNTPTVLNKRSISGNIGFKVIAKTINLSNYTTTLKLKEIGKIAGDSVI